MTQFGAQLWARRAARACRFATAAMAAALLAACASGPGWFGANAQPAIENAAPSAPWTPRAAPYPVQQHGALSVRGTQIVDAHGQPVTLRGMSLFWSQWMPQYYNPQAVRWLRDDWNVDIVRAAIAVPGGGYLRHPERELRKADLVIRAAIEHGVYVIVDWHAHHPEPDAAVEFFTTIAQRYGDYPNVIYEPWNEPLDTHDWARDIKPYHERVIAAIRAHDPDNLIIVGSSSWSQDVDIAAADPIGDANLAYVLHFYAGTHREPLRQKARAAMALGAALFVSEYGVTEASGDGPIDVAETQRWWAFMEEHQISYLAWSISDKDETSAALRDGAAGEGGWADSELTESGALLRVHLRAYHAEQ